MLQVLLWTDRGSKVCSDDTRHNSQARLTLVLIPHLRSRRGECDGRVSATMCEWHNVSTNLRQCPHLLVVAKGFRGLLGVGGELECSNEGNELPIRHSARLSTRRAVADRLARPDRPTPTFGSSSAPIRLASSSWLYPCRRRRTSFQS